MSPQWADAAFVLAELAYFDDQPQQVARWVHLIDDNLMVLDQLSSQQRLDIMVEWATAKGEHITTKLPNSFMVAPMSVPRALSLPVSLIGVAAGPSRCAGAAVHAGRGETQAADRGSADAQP